MCDYCRAQLPLLPAGLDICLSQHQQNLCIEHIDGLCSAAVYRWPVNKWVYGLKFGAKPECAKVLGYFLAKQLEQHSWPVDHIVSVPLSWIRYFNRGYNQSDLLLKEILLYIHPLSDVGRCKSLYRDLIRHRHTQPQAKLNQQQRMDNVDKVFKCKTPIMGKRILLIDDVVTTAHTINQAARALKNAGAAKVYVGCAALKILD